MGHLIPAGTGFYHHREVEFAFTVEEPKTAKFQNPVALRGPK
jgi:hypothetical protein